MKRNILFLLLNFLVLQINGESYSRGLDEGGIVWEDLPTGNHLILPTIIGAVLLFIAYTIIKAKEEKGGNLSFSAYIGLGCGIVGILCMVPLFLWVFSLGTALISSALIIFMVVCAIKFLLSFWEESNNKNQDN